MGEALSLKGTQLTEERVMDTAWEEMEMFEGQLYATLKDG